MVTPPESAKQMVSTISQGLKKSGRKPEGFDMAGCAWFSVAEQSRAAKDTIRKVIAYFGPYLEEEALKTIGVSLKHFNRIKELVLDPGTSAESLAETLNSFTMVRRAACKKSDELLGFPLLGVPMTVWRDQGKVPDEILKWREAQLATMLMVRYADILLLHSVDGWSLLPNTVLRQNIYTDPQKPIRNEARPVPNRGA
jgi:CO dehydrogenase/acetyl-CoA synthase gamma subunit (corrinoid Fe-S protein)